MSKRKSKLKIEKEEKYILLVDHHKSINDDDDYIKWWWSWMDWTTRFSFSLDSNDNKPNEYKNWFENDLPYLSLATESIDGFLSENEKCKHQSIFEKHAPLFTVMVDWMWNIFVACWLSLLLLWLLVLLLESKKSINILFNQTNKIIKFDKFKIGKNMKIFTVLFCWSIQKIWPTLIDQIFDGQWQM